MGHATPWPIKRWMAAEIVPSRLPTKARCRRGPQGSCSVRPGKPGPTWKKNIRPTLIQNVNRDTDRVRSSTISMATAAPIARTVSEVYSGISPAVMDQGERMQHHDRRAEVHEAIVIRSASGTHDAPERKPRAKPFAATQNERRQTVKARFESAIPGAPPVPLTRKQISDPGFDTGHMRVRRASCIFCACSLRRTMSSAARLDGRAKRRIGREAAPPSIGNRRKTVCSAEKVPLLQRAGCTSQVSDDRRSYR